MSRRPLDEMWTKIHLEYAQERGLVPDEEPEIDLMTPKQIVEELDKTVIGQDDAKQLVSIAVFNRMLARSNEALGRNKEEFFFEKNNILLIGGTGCGKTHLIKALAEVVSLPVTIQDATSFTCAGYIGGNIEDCVQDLVDKAEDMLEKKYNVNAMNYEKYTRLLKKTVKYGIIYMDEADKIRANSGARNDVNGRKVQEGMLKLIEGTEVKVTTKQYKETIDTSDMLFIFGGAFSDLEKSLKEKHDVKNMGFSKEADSEMDIKDIRKKARIEDLTDFGMIPELLGRLSTLAILSDLDREMIARIFVEPRRSIMSQVINEFKSYGAQVSFTQDAVDLIVDRTMEIKLGARGLKSTCQQLLRPLHFYLPSNLIYGDVVITKELLEKLEKDGLC